MNQATNARNSNNVSYISFNAAKAARNGPKVISITSGKGGVGKTNIVANLAFALCNQGKRVMILDADLGLANIDILLGLAPKYTIGHVFSGEKTISEILVEGPGGMRIMPASSGVQELTELSESQKLFLLNELDGLRGLIDIMFIDTGAGISSNVLYFNLAAQERVIVATPEPTSIADAYALIKILFTRHDTKRFSVLINQAHTPSEGQQVFKKLAMVADRFLGSLSLDYWGCIPYDANIPRAVKQQRAVVELYPDASSSKQFRELAGRICGRMYDERPDGNIKFFWKNLLQM
ncbi:MAG: MinD/ParA family protein [Pseudomonadota bacterium]